MTPSAGNGGRLPASPFAEETFGDRAAAWNSNGRFEIAPVDTVRIIE